jgi:tetratricopeptide (TPR) repeat protein
MPVLPDTLAREVARIRSAPRRATSPEARQYLVEGAKLLHAGRRTEAEARFREALRLDPEDVDSLNNLGNCVWQQGRSSEAMAYFLRAYQYNQNDFGVLNNLGIVLWELNRPERAIEYYRRALKIRPDSFDTKMNLGVSLSDVGSFDEALVWLRGAVMQDPTSADAWDNVGMTLARQGHWVEAMRHYDEAIRLRPDFGEARRNRALGWLGMGDFERGFPESEWRLMCRTPPGFKFPRPRWRGEPLGGQVILLHYEQGLGDTVQFIRFAPLVKERGGRVWVFCQAPMARLVAQCPGVEQVFDGSGNIPDFPVHAGLMSVPSIIRTTGETLPRDPYLRADKATIDFWRPHVARAFGVENLDSVFKIGIAWQGSPKNHIDRWRSFPLAQLAPLARLPGVRLFRLQKSDGLDQMATRPDQFPIAELEPQFDDRRDFLDTAALMSLVDMVITPETSVAHLAGAVGARTWVALSHVGDWRWMISGDSTPWYPTVEIIRQTTQGDWDGVFRRMEKRLAKELKARR